MPWGQGVCTRAREPLQSKGWGARVGGRGRRRVVQWGRAKGEERRGRAKGKSESKTVKVSYVCGNIGTHMPDSSPDTHAFEAISACAHETLPQSRLAKDLVIGKSGEVCSQPSYCRICRSRCTDCDLGSKNGSAISALGRRRGWGV